MPYKILKVKLFLLFFILYTIPCFSQEITNPTLEITEEDGSPSTYPYRLKFPNGTITDNGDSTTSVFDGSGDIYVNETGDTMTGDLKTSGADIDIADDTPHLTFRDTDDNVAYQWHLDTSSANAPWQNYALWRGTDSGSGFSVNPSTPLIYFDNDNKVRIPLAGNLNVVGKISLNDGNGNVFIGDGVGSGGIENTFLGISAGANNSVNAGEANMFIGYEAGLSITTGYGDTFVGTHAGRLNTTGYDNTFIGFDAGRNNTTGYENTFIGEDSGRVNSTGYRNVYVGDKSAYNNTTGYQNIFIGQGSGYNNLTGLGNVFLGYNVGYSETGSNKLYIDNSNTTSPLIYGEFDNNILTINGTLLKVSSTVGVDATFSLSDADVAHGITSLVDTDIFYNLKPISSTVGGTYINSLSDGDGQPLEIRGIFGTSNPTDATPAVKIVGAVASGTTIADMGSDETIFSVANNDNTAALTVAGDGDVTTIANITAAGLKISGSVDITDGMGIGSAGASISTQFVDIDNVWSGTTGINYNTYSLMQAEPSVTTGADYRSIGGEARMDTAQTSTEGVIGIFGSGSVNNNIAATLQGSTGSDGLIGGFFTADAEDSTSTTYAAGVFFDIPSLDTGVLTNAYGIRVGAQSVGTGAVTTTYGLYLPNINDATTNWDIYHDSTTAEIGLKSTGTIFWKDAGGNTLMSIKDNGSTGLLTVTGTAAIGGSLTVGQTTANASLLYVNGSLGLPIATKTSSYTATANDFMILGDATSGTLTVTLPAASGVAGRIYCIKKIDSAANNVIIDPNGSELIDGVSTLALSTQYLSYIIICDGSAWYIMALYT